MPPANKLPTSRRFLTRQEQGARYGVSPRSIVRWGEDPKMKMPPEYEFNRIKKRREDELEIWERSLVATVAAE